MPYSIRRAKAGDAAKLTALALRSKASHGYDEAFMLRVAPLLDFSTVDVEAAYIFVAEREDALLGFYRLTSIEGRGFLDDLWIDPPVMRSGVGRMLWQHARAFARSLSWTELLIESDPGAEAFYLRMGARRIGTQRSGAGRELPLLRFSLGEASDPSQRELPA